MFVRKPLAASRHLFSCGPKARCEHLGGFWTKLPSKKVDLQKSSRFAQLEVPPCSETVKYIVLGQAVLLERKGEVDPIENPGLVYS